MRKLVVVFAMAVFAGCGVETVGTAATGAAVKQKEIQEGRKTMEQAQQKAAAAMAEVQQRAEKDADKQ